MKHSLKLTVALSLFASPHIYSDTACSVFLAPPCYSFEVQATALLLQPTGSNLHYAAEAIPLPTVSPNWNIYEISTDYHFGFDVGAGAILSHANTNLTANWEHFHSSDSASKQVSSENMIGPFFEIGPDALPYKKAHGKVSFHFDAINVDYGIFVHFGDRLTTNLYSGLSYGSIKQTVTSKYSDLEETIHRTIKVPSTYWGVGPQLGLDFSYCIVEGFQFTGGLASSFLVGTQKNHTNYSSVSPALAGLGAASPNNQRTHVHKKTQMVPELAGNLGLSYSSSCCNCVVVTVEAGYQAQVYFNAIQSVNIGSEVVTPPVAPDTVGVYARTFELATSDFSLAGPYLKVEIGF